MDNLPEYQNMMPSFIQKHSESIKRNSAGSNQVVYNHSNENSPDALKSKKTRRRPRIMNKTPRKQLIGTEIDVTSISQSMPSSSKKSNNKIKNATEKVVEPIISFNSDISRQAGSFIKTRNTKAKYIKLRSFLTKGSKAPHIFKTDLTIFKLVENLNNLDLGSKQVIKALRKKYPKNKRKILVRANSTQDNQPFPEYMNEEEVNKGLKDGSLIKGIVRINPKSPKTAYINNEDRSQTDYYLTSIRDRNRALEGDEVVFKIKPEAEWEAGYKTVTVVYLKELVHSRVMVGHIPPAKKSTANYALFYPRDKRGPIVRIPEILLPNGLKEHPKEFADILFVAKIISWDVPAYAIGTLTENLGKHGNLRVESLSILREFGLNVTPFSEEVTRNDLKLPKCISNEEFVYRADLRKTCIFTIDPVTARDLDDAVSVKTLNNGNYEVGVHISDASYYLKEGTELDKLVSKKATTIYLVDTVYHMLPEEMCVYCSLLPGEDKLSFSVFWEMTTEGEILDTRFCRSIINSCVKLSYEHAQKIIDCSSTQDFSDEEFPQIYNNFSIDDIAKSVKTLHQIAVELRKERVKNGALKIDQIKISFNIEPGTGEPSEFNVYENQPAHRLIEEFMLLANITVAEKIKDAFPKIAFLRCHERPKETMLVELRNCLETYGIHIDITSSGSIRSSLQKYETNDYAGVCRSTVLNHLLAKAMTRARYFCAASVSTDLGFSHYALSVPIYTHFTSPIRRYADIMVHRLLAASLGYCDPPKWDVDYVRSIAANCNALKYNAKRAGDASIELFLSHYVEKHQPFVADCAVVAVKERSFDAIVLKTGSIVRIYLKNSENDTQWTTNSVPISEPEVETSNDKRTKFEKVKKAIKLTVKFPQTRYLPEVCMDIEMFTMVKISLERKSNSYKLEGKLIRPMQELIFTPNK